MFPSSCATHIPEIDSDNINKHVQVNHSGFKIKISGEESKHLALFLLAVHGLLAEWARR